MKSLNVNIDRRTFRRSLKIGIALNVLFAVILGMALAKGNGVALVVSILLTVASALSIYGLITKIQIAEEEKAPAVIEQKKDK